MYLSTRHKQVAVGGFFKKAVGNTRKYKTNNGQARLKTNRNNQFYGHGTRSSQDWNSQAPRRSAKRWAAYTFNKERG